MKFHRRTFAEIDLDALESNWNFLNKNFPQTFICPMVKANAYGHGDVMIARTLEALGARQLGVCLIEEGLLLRHFNLKAEILVFRGFDREGARAMLENQLTPVVSSWDQLEILENLAKAQSDKDSQKIDSSSISFHLKFDTGMNRLGFAVNEGLALAEKIKSQRALKLKGVLTHLVSGENSVDTTMTESQLDSFKNLLEIFQFFKVPFHALNSGGLLTQLCLRKSSSVNQMKSSWADRSWGLRPGLVLYGYNPGVDQSFPEIKSVMSLKSHVAVLRTLKEGEGVSYNHTWKAKKKSQVAVVPMGYADGYHRSLSNRGFALYHGQRVPVVGNVCMDYLMLDVSAAPVSVNSEVILFGRDQENHFLSATELAQAGNTITWEILTSISERVPRIYKGNWAEKLKNQGEDLCP